jgi:hypothetical protein
MMDDSPLANERPIGELICCIFIIAGLIAGGIAFNKYRHVFAGTLEAPALKSEISNLQAANQALRDQHLPLVRALYQLPVNHIITFGDTNNPIQWQRIR